jgi:hypothetical protein
MSRPRALCSVGDEREARESALATEEVEAYVSIGGAKSICTTAAA